MTEKQEQPSREIANAGANRQLTQYHMHLPIERRIKLHRRYYDSILASIWAYQEMAGAHRVRATTLASEN